MVIIGINFAVLEQLMLHNKFHSHQSVDSDKGMVTILVKPQKPFIFIENFIQVGPVAFEETFQTVEI